MSIRRNKMEQRKICEDWQQSRLTQTEYCRQNNIQFYALNRWLRNLRKKTSNVGNTSKSEKVPTTQGIKFFSVDKPNVTSINSNFCKSLLEVTLPNGINFKAYLPEDSVNVYLRELLK